MKLKLFISFIAIMWVGMILATDIGAVLKFSVPSLSKPVAFEIGRLVFDVFNKIQLVMLLVLIASAVFASLAPIDKTLIGTVFVLLLLQVFWLFPVLSSHVDLVLKGVEIQSNYQHKLYGIFELAKMLTLFILGIRLLRQ